MEGEGGKEGKVKIRKEMIMDGFKNTCDENHNEEEGKLLLSTKEVNSSLYIKNTEEKQVDNSSIDSSTSCEDLSQSDLSDSAVATKRVSKRKRNRYLKKKWAMIPILKVNERQLKVAKRRLAKVKGYMAENTEECGKSELEQGKGDMTENSVLKNKICQVEKIEKKAAKKFWQKGIILRAFGRKENENLSVVIPGSPQKSKLLVHNSGIIRIKLERLRNSGKNTKVQLESLKKVMLDKIQVKIKLPNSDFITTPASCDTKSEDLKHTDFISGKVDSNSDYICTCHNPLKVQQKAKTSFDLRSYLSAYIGKASGDPPDIAVAHKIKGKKTDQRIPISPQWSSNLETRNSGARTDQNNLVPYMPNYPSWASPQAEADFLWELALKRPSIKYKVPRSNDSVAPLPNDPLSHERKTPDVPGPSYARSALNEISDAGQPNPNDSEHSNPDFITKSGFSNVDLGLGDKESVKESGTCLSSIRKKLQGWGQAIRGGLTRRGPEKNSGVSADRESRKREEPKGLSVKNPNKTKKNSFGKNKSVRQVVPLTLTFCAVPRINVVNREEWMEERDQGFPGDNKLKE